MLLARSNRARLPRPVGVPIPRWSGEEPEPETAPPTQSVAPGAVPDLPDAVARPLGTIDTGQPKGTRAAPVPPPAAARVQPPAPGTRPARWVLETAVQRDRGEVLTAMETASPVRASEKGPETGANAPTDRTLSVAQPPLEQPWRPAIRIDWPWKDPAEPVPESPVPEALGTQTPPLAVLAAASQPGPGATGTPPEAAPQAQRAGPVSSFALGRGPDAPVVEAELLVHVSARPGTLVDLYGRPLRVGPSGRSTLRIPVTDLTSLERLLGSPADTEGPTGGD